LNFLNLTKRLLQICGVAGTISTISNQTGELLRLVNYIEDAYQDVLNYSDHWNFLWSSFSAEVSGTEFTLTDLGITEFNRFDYTTIRGNSKPLTYLPYHEFKHTSTLGECFWNTSEVFTITPDKKIKFNSIFTGTLSGEYYKSPSIVSTDEDIPLIPEQFQMIIVYRAAMFYAVYTAEPDKYTDAFANYDKILNRMIINETPMLTVNSLI
jgi:hypothetical protein